MLAHKNYITLGMTKIIMFYIIQDKYYGKLTCGMLINLIETLVKIIIQYTVCIWKELNGMPCINISPKGVQIIMWFGMYKICEYLQYGTKVRYIWKENAYVMKKSFYMNGMYIHVYIYDWSVYKNCRKRYLQFIYILLKIITCS